MVEVGMEVNYVPDTIHAFIPFTENGKTLFTWAVGLKAPNGEVKELGFEDLVRLKRNRSASLSKSVFLHPNKLWNAVVTEVHEDGSVELDVISGGVTHHCSNVKQDASGKIPHTFHPKGE
jgi:hypothetical protein